MALQAEEGEFTPSQLQEIASEMGISETALQKAMQEWQDQQSASPNPPPSSAQPKPPQSSTSQPRGSWQRPLLQWLSLSGFFLGLNLVTCGLISWAVFPILGTGLGFALKGDQRWSCKSRPAVER
jgi:hypothetical protein